MKLFCILGFILISLFGSFLHFVYDMLKHNKYISMFVAVNESTWEHLKLAIIPTFIWAIVGAFLGYNNFAFAVSISVITEIVVIPAIFYSYTAITKKPILAIDILSFFIAIGLGMFFAYLIISAAPFGMALHITGIICSLTIATLTIIFTYYPPHIFLFIDPISKKYGRAGHFDDKTFGNNFTLKK